MTLSSSWCRFRWLTAIVGLAMLGWFCVPEPAGAAVSRPVNLSAVTNNCPFCSAIALTFSEQLNANEVAVVAKLVEPPPPPSNDEDDFPKGKFEIVGVLKGGKFVQEGMTFQTQLVGSYPEGQKFLVMGVSPPKIAWTTPMRASDRVFNYLRDIQKLPEKGPQRLIFFQDFFEDTEPVLAFDAYDEFAKAPYEDLIAMKDQMQREKLIGWIKDTENTTVNRRRLYLTMLGVCGQPEDAQMLETFIKSGDRKQQAGLDALVACYLRLKGEAGVALIEDAFLKEGDVDYVDTLAAVSALRFHATETDVIPRERIVAAVRLLLDRPKMADMIIPDLARWEDWSVMERLVKMFKEADGESSWLRVPVITYLRACPKPEAAKYIEELKKIDPQAVQRADFFIGFGEEGGGDDDWDDDSSEEGGEPQPSADESGSGSKADKGKAGGKIDGGRPTAARLSVPDHRVELAQGYQPPVVGPFPDGGPHPDSDGEFGESIPVSVEAQRESVEQASFVSVRREPPTPDATVPDSRNAAAELPDPDRLTARAETTQTLGTVEQRGNLTLSILLVPFAGSMVLFVLMWSVVNGWFERLIF